VRGFRAIVIKEVTDKHERDWSVMRENESERVKHCKTNATTKTANNWSTKRQHSHVDQIDEPQKHSKSRIVEIMKK
jgi:hypothetical protein